MVMDETKKYFLSDEISLLSAKFFFTHVAYNEHKRRHEHERTS